MYLKRELLVSSFLTSFLDADNRDGHECSLFSARLLMPRTFLTCRLQLHQFLKLVITKGKLHTPRPNYEKIITFIEITNNHLWLFFFFYHFQLCK